MPATRSRTSTEQAEVAVEEVKKSEVEQTEENTKESLGNDEQSNDNTTSSTTDEKDVESENGNEDAEDSQEVQATNGASEVVTDVSGKRKSEVGEGDGPDSTEITPKKVKLDEEIGENESEVVQEAAATGQIEASA